MIYKNKDIFISHNWGKDNLNRDNHERCKLLCDKLLKHGYKVWFDSYDMYGNIDSCISKGINNCKIVIVCLTETYSNKINNAVNMQTLNDNCFKEWNYTLFKNKIIIPVIMEEKMKTILLKEDGIVQMYLNSTMFIDFSDNLEDEFNFLCKTIKKFNVYTSKENKFIKSPNNSFDNLLLYFSKIVSPRSPRLSRSPRSPRSPILSNLKKNNRKKIRHIITI